jgi:hypothetical protein
MSEATDKELLKQQYDIIRALTVKLGRDVTLTKEEFMESYGEHLTMQHHEGAMIFRVWPRPDANPVGPEQEAKTNPTQ